MNAWNRPHWYERARKRPPPEHGIKIKKVGSTWWGQRWIEALDRMSAGYSNRLARGRTYARAGRTHDLVVDAGVVTAKVTGSRPKDYDVTLRIPPLSDRTWNEAIRSMAKKARFSAELLTGQMPKDIDEAFVAANASLFPVEETDLLTECSCPDWANPCKHVAATHYVLGEAFDRDPFLLFELRGRTKNDVLEALRAARSGDVSTETKEAPSYHVTLENVKAADYDEPRQPLPALHLSFEKPVVHGAVLQQLGAPATWIGDASPADLLTPLLRATAEEARRIALAEPATEPPDNEAALATERPVRKRGRKRAPRGGKPRRIR